MYWAIAALALLMAATRMQHFGSAVTLPDASLAVFFLGGLLSLPAWGFVLLVAEAVLIDFLAIQVYGVSGWCVTPAYPFLLLGYAVMWAGGRWNLGREADALPRVVPTLVASLMAVTLAFVISNASFYALSGYFADKSMADFAGSVIQYLPSYVGWTLAYIGLGWLAITAIRQIPRVARHPSARAG